MNASALPQTIASKGRNGHSIAHDHQSRKTQSWDQTVSGPGNCAPADRLRAHDGQYCWLPVDSRATQTNVQWDLSCSSKTLERTGGEATGRTPPVPPERLSCCRFTAETSAVTDAPPPILPLDEEVLTSTQTALWLDGPDSGRCSRLNGHGRALIAALHSGPPRPRPHLAPDQAPADPQCPPEGPISL